MLFCCLSIDFSLSKVNLPCSSLNEHLNLITGKIGKTWQSRACCDGDGMGWEWMPSTHFYSNFSPIPLSPLTSPIIAANSIGLDDDGSFLRKKFALTVYSNAWVLKEENMF